MSMSEVPISPEVNLAFKAPKYAAAQIIGEYYEAKNKTRTGDPTNGEI